MNREANIYDRYLAGTVAGTTDELEVALDQQVQQFLVYPLANSKIKLGNSSDEIFLPANTWTPIGVLLKKFTIRTLEGTADIHWQGWYI